MLNAIDIDLKIFTSSDIHFPFHDREFFRSHSILFEAPAGELAIVLAFPIYEC